MNDIVSKIQKINFTGNIIPQNWFKHIKRGKTQKPDLTAMWILADIIYWYKPVEIRDEGTGKIIGYKKKFKSDKLQKSYDSYSKLLGIPKKTIKESFKLLKELGLIIIEFRNLETETGLKLINVMFVEPVPENIEKITFEDVEVSPKMENEYIPNTEGGIYQNGIDPLTDLGNTNTENTTENTTTTTTSFINIEEQKKSENDFEDLQPLNDKALENNYNLQRLIKEMQISLSDVKKLIAYRKVLKKPLKTMRGLIGLLNAIKNTSKATRKSFDEIFEIMMENEWQSIKPEYLIKKDTKTKEKETYFDEEFGVEVRKGANWTDEDFEF